MKIPLLVVVLLLACLFLPASSHGQSSMEVAALQCEYMAEPLGLDAETPRFTWQLTDSKHTRGQKQTAYQVLVASSLALLEAGRADLWDSGIKPSGQSALVEYGGKKLVSNQVGYWKVRAYDKHKKASSWSAPARFSMGLLAASDWKGDWVKHPAAPAEQHIWFRKSFTLDKTLAQGFLHLASMGYHELYINGKKADNRVLAPAQTRMDKRVLYVTYDIAPLLQAGKNTIAIWYGPGWSRYEHFKKGVDQALQVQLDGRRADGALFSLHTDTSWKCQVSPGRNIGLFRDGGRGSYGGELFDARKNVPHWKEVGFDDSNWLPAKKIKQQVALSAHTMAPSRIIDTLAPASMSVAKKGGYRVDMGKNFTGFLELKLRGMAAGDTVLIKTADDANTIMDFGQMSTYICRGGGEETFTNRFNFMAGRYITLEGLKQKPQLSDLRGFAIATDLKRTGHFVSSSELFNQIYETDLLTYRMCTTEGYTSDCPHRERLGYGEVAFATAWGIALPNYQAGAYLAKHVRDWADVQENNGWINHTAPQVNKVWGGPLWSSAGLNIAWEYYQTFGDKRILEATYPSSRKWLEFLHAHASSGLLKNYYTHFGRFLGDWAAPGPRREEGGSPEAQYFNNCVYAFNLETFVQIATLLGRPDDAALYQARLEALRPRIHERFYQAAKGIYLQGNQVQTAFAISRDIAPPHLRPALLAHFDREFTQGPGYLDMGSSGLPILLKFVTEEKESPEEMARYLSKTDVPSYGHFLQRGETAWPEFWNGDVASRIHTCYTGIASWFIKSLGGIRPDPAYPGYQRMLIKPSPVPGLTFARAETGSLYGPIKSAWKREGSKLTLHISVPVNAVATVFVPVKKGKQVREGGNRLPKVKGVKKLRQEEDCLVLEVESGIYEFVSEQ